MSAQPTPAHSDFAVRTLVALPLLGVLAATTLSGGLAFTLLAVVAALICLSELYAMLRLPPIARVAGSLLTGAALIATWSQGQSELGIILLVPALAITADAVLLARPRVRDWASLRMLLGFNFGIYWIGLCLAHAILLRDLPHGVWLLTFVLAGTIASDTVAYLGGRWIGTTPLTSISPNKTVEGAALGFVAAVSVVVALALYQPWINLGQSLVLGVGVALAAPCGDLFESWIKRRYKVKDASHLLGPHGGLLDRIDAVLFAAVAGYWICQAYGF